MNKTEIIIVSKFFYPQNTPRAFRTTELVKEFAKLKHEVTLLIPNKSQFHLEFEKQYGIRIKDIGSLNFKEIKIPDNKGIKRLANRIISRIMRQFFEYPDIQYVFKVKKALSLENNYDLLITIANPHSIHWGTAWARSNGNKIAQTWIADCGDPFMGQKMSPYKKPFYFSFIEKAFCRNADIISVPTQEAKQAYYREFHDKIEVIPQGFNFEEATCEHQLYKQNHVPTFAYAGAFYKRKRDPRNFLDYLLEFKKEFKFILYTKDLNLLEPYLKRAPKKILVRDYIPRKRLIDVLSQMDFLVNFKNDTKGQTPSKLIDYYLTGRPVLSISPKNFNKKIVSKFLEGDYSEKYIFSGIEKYRISNVAQKFLSLII